MTTISISPSFLTALFNCNNFQNLPRLVLFTKSFDIETDSFPAHKEKIIDRFKKWLSVCKIQLDVEKFKNSFIERNDMVQIPFEVTEENITEFDLEGSRRFIG